MTITRFEPGKRLAGAVRHADTLYLSGQVADNADAGIDTQTTEVLAKLDALLKAGGSDRSRLLMVNIYLTSMLDFAAMNAVYDAWVDKANLPARATVEARLADPALRIEITAIAACA